MDITIMVSHRKEESWANRLIVTNATVDLIQMIMIIILAQEFCVENCSEEFFFDFLNEWPWAKMDLNGLSRYCFIILKDTMGCLFWKNFSTASYGRESSLCGNQTPICDIRSYHVRLVLFLSPSLTSFPNFSLTCLTQVKIKITKDSCRLRHVLSQRYASRQTTRIWDLVPW